MIKTNEFFAKHTKKIGYISYNFINSLFYQLFSRVGEVFGTGEFYYDDGLNYKELGLQLPQVINFKSYIYLILI